MRVLALISILFLPLILVALVVVVGVAGVPALQTFGWAFLVGQTWDPVHQIFGALPFIYGTAISSLLALAFALPVGMGSALFLAEPGQRWLRNMIGIGVELLAAVPSVVFGLWGLLVLAPWLAANIETPLSNHLGWIPLLAGPASGPSLFAAAMVLAVMILPTLTSISRDVLRAVPPSMAENSLALGATWWESRWQVVLRAARPGIFGATILALGRALGETMAVTMVIGNRPALGGSLFAPGYTLASILANEFAEATGRLYPSALISLGLILILLTLLVNGLALLLIRLVR
ncbi:MAG: phosphate ABC transporter permease subunit PstC [Candidatus Dormibacteraceae bacterium]